MQVTTYTTRDYTRANMGEWLFDAWRDGRIEPDESFMGDYESFAQFGRRTLYYADGQMVEEYICHATYEDAVRQMFDYHDNRAPVYEFDLIIQEDRADYHVSLEGLTVGSYKTRDAAELAAAWAMADHGCFPDAFYINERGMWHRIDNEIREYHDAGGDGMRDEWTNVTPEDVDRAQTAS